MRIIASKPAMLPGREQFFTTPVPASGSDLTLLATSGIHDIPALRADAIASKDHWQHWSKMQSDTARLARKGYCPIPNKCLYIPDNKGVNRYKYQLNSCLASNIMDYRVMPEIELEYLGHGHAQELYEVIEENREYLIGWIQCVKSIQSAEDIRLFIEAEIPRYTQHRSPYFAIKYDGRICGLIAFRELDKSNKIGTISYWLSEPFTGKGIASQAVKYIVGFGFEELELNKIQISCASGNRKSRAIPERLGFTYEATLRQCEWLNSRYVDHAIYTMLATEYYSARNAQPSPPIPKGCNVTPQNRLGAPGSVENT